MAMSSADAVESEEWGDADRAELRGKLRRSQRRQRMRALMLVAPLFLFILLTFITPIFSMLSRSVDNSIVPETLPRTVEALADWDQNSGELPDEAVFAALRADLEVAVEERTNGRLGSRLTFELPAASSLFRSARGALRRADEPPYREKFIDARDKWGDLAVWQTLKNFSGNYTLGYYLDSIGLEYALDGSIVSKPEQEQIHIGIFLRTILLSIVITVSALLLAYPIAYLMANVKLRYANLLLILVLLPFWTSLLVRTSAWMVLLQNQGVVNDMLVFTGLNEILLNLGSLVGMNLDPASLCQNDMRALNLRGADFLETLQQRQNIVGAELSYCAQEVLTTLDAQGADAALARGQEMFVQGEEGFYPDARIPMFKNQFATIVAMTHILLPFMVLPIYSVMKTIPPTIVRAAKSLGARNSTAFWRVYFPNTIPGIGAGVLLVFVLAIGYYITPQLVGGVSGLFISNKIAEYIDPLLNWPLAAALSTLLLLLVLVLYYTYDRLVGISNVRLG